MIFQSLLLILLSNCLFAHGVSESTANAMSSASSLLDCIDFGGKHMVTGYDHILFLIGILFFLTNYFDIFKFITAFTVAHCLTLIFATYWGITANTYLIDAVIAFSVVYKGFENLSGFKKCFSINAPNLLLMVFTFGLIHGFGLSTKLQEVALESNIELSLSQILSFNIGVELGQVIVLIILFPLLSLIRGNSFKIVSKICNWILIFCGVFLLIYQLNNYFNNHTQNHQAKEVNSHHHHH